MYFLQGDSSGLFLDLSHLWLRWDFISLTELAVTLTLCDKHVHSVPMYLLFHKRAGAGAKLVDWVYWRDEDHF